jgi:hypothetical protein
MSDDCLVILEKWLIEQKNKIYDEHVKSDNDENELQDYSDSLEDFARDIIEAIEDENTSKLRDLEWPQDLIDCIKDVGIRVDIINSIDSWFIRYPFNRSKNHIKELQRENAGLQ